MDKVLRPERLETDPGSSSASTDWVHWKRTFENFLSVLSRHRRSIDKLGVLVNYVSPTIFRYIEDCTDFDRAMQVLEGLYIKPTNEIYARHVLATRRQQPTETLDEFLLALKTLSKDCNFKDATAARYYEESIRDAFITGLQSSIIRQRLLENKTLDLNTMFDQARVLESAARSCEIYTTTQPSVSALVPPPPTPQSLQETSTGTLAASQAERQSCFFVEIADTHVPSAQPVMLHVTTVIKMDILLKSAEESLPNPLKSQLPHGLQLLPLSMPVYLEFFRNLQLQLKSMVFK